MEKTLVIIKPCALQRGLVGEVLSRFEKALRLWPSKCINSQKKSVPSITLI